MRPLAGNPPTDITCCTLCQTDAARLRRLDRPSDDGISGDDGDGSDGGGTPSGEARRAARRDAHRDGWPPLTTAALGSLDGHVRLIDLSRGRLLLTVDVGAPVARLSACQVWVGGEGSAGSTARPRERLLVRTLQGKYALVCTEDGRSSVQPVEVPPGELTVQRPPRGRSAMGSAGGGRASTAPWLLHHAVGQCLLTIYRAHVKHEHSRVELVPLLGFRLPPCTLPGSLSVG